MTPKAPFAIPARQAHVGGPQIRRILPWAQKRMVGPFIFLDHFPQTPFQAGEGFKVRSHPHIGLSTLSYLLEGAVLHHDSLGCKQVLLPGDVNWMTAGRGISHSEKTPEHLLDKSYVLHLLQFWVALPVEDEQVEPSFTHHPAHAIPETIINDVQLRIVAGEFAGYKSPVKNYSPLHFVDVKMKAGGRLQAEAGQGHESAFYVLDGEVQFEGPAGPIAAKAGECYFLGTTGETHLRSNGTAHLVLFGGQAFAEDRYIEWNFVASDRKFIEAAKVAWVNGHFPRVPGETDFIPLP